jgi:hypothetical protein
MSPDYAINKISKYITKAVNALLCFLCHIVKAFELPLLNFSLPKPSTLLQSQFTKRPSGHYRSTFRALNIPVSFVIEADFVKFSYISLREVVVF